MHEKTGMHKKTGQSISRRGVLGGAAATIGAASLLGRSRRGFGQNRPIQVLVVADPFFYALQGVVDQFTEQTGIDVTITSLSYEALQARLVSSFVSGNPDADVISVDNIWLGQYLQSKWITPLNERIKADKDVNLEEFVPEVLYSMNTWRGEFGTLPVAAYGMGVMYRRDFADQAGLTIPSDGSWTWAEYLDAIHKMNGQQFDGHPMAGSVVAGQQPAPIVHMFSQLSASMGARWFASFPRAPWNFEPRLDSPETVEAISLFRDIYENSPPEAVNYNWFDAGMRFARGDIGMFYWWSAYFYLCRKDGYMSGEKSVVADVMGIVPIPHSDAPQVGGMGGWSFGITANSALQDEAWMFVKWAASAETQKAMALYDKYGHQFSDFARRPLFEDPELLEIYPYLPVQLRGLEQGNGKIVRPPVPTYTTLESIYGLNLNRVLSGEFTPEQCVEQTDALWTNVLKGNFMIPYSLDSYNDTLEATKSLIESLA